MSLIRIDRLLSDMGLGSRSQAKEWIKKGQVQVDGCVCRKTEQKVDAGIQEIKLNGRIVCYEEYVYYILHKPAGCVTALKDKKNKTVMDYMPKECRKDLTPVGRLDKDTEGLLLFTNDGKLAHQLLSPKSHVDKTYFARVKGKVTSEDVEAFMEGLDIGDDKRTLPARLTVRKSGQVSEVEVIVCEGRFHQIKRMFQAVGKEVIYLKRISFGKLVLDNTLKVGQYRKVKKEDILDDCK